MWRGDYSSNQGNYVLLLRFQLCDFCYIILSCIINVYDRKSMEELKDFMGLLIWRKCHSTKKQRVCIFYVFVFINVTVCLCKNSEDCICLCLCLSASV